jgi:hypothetical protein
MSNVSPLCVPQENSSRTEISVASGKTEQNGFLRERSIWNDTVSHAIIEGPLGDNGGKTRRMHGKWGDIYLPLASFTGTCSPPIAFLISSLISTVDSSSGGNSFRKTINM